MALNINGTTGISGVDGSASAPAVTGTDSNTGINFASDTVNINTGGVARATVDSSGNLGIGISNPTTLLHLKVNQQTAKMITLNGDDARNNYIGINSGDNLEIAADEDAAGSASTIRFRVDGSERMRIKSDGSVLIGRTTDASVAGSLLQIKNITVETDGDTTGMFFNRTDSNAAWVAMRFYVQGSQKGYIQVNTGSVTYSTSSDYRLKENVVSISDGITRLKQLKPYRFNFKSDSSTTLDGFYAHEASEVVPESVVGEKDAMEKIYYKEGDTIPSDKEVGDFKEFSTTEIDPQGIDQSKLVPLLTAALQEAIAKIEVLETKVAALEAG